MIKNRSCPYSDRLGNSLEEGDVIVHPNGQVGFILYDKSREDWSVVESKGYKGYIRLVERTPTVSWPNLTTRVSSNDISHEEYLDLLSKDEWRRATLSCWRVKYHDGIELWLPPQLERGEAVRWAGSKASISKSCLYTLVKYLYLRGRLYD